MAGRTALMVSSALATQTPKLAVRGSKIIQRTRNFSNLGRAALTHNFTTTNLSGPAPRCCYSTTCCCYSATSKESSYVGLIRRQQVLKESDEECRRVLTSPASRFLPYFKGQPLVRQGTHQPVLLTRAEVEPHLKGGRSLEDSAVWLNAEQPEESGDDGLSVTFAVPVETEAVATPDGKFVNLRLAMLFLGSTAPMLSQGSSLLRWHNDTKFCAKCGSADVKKSVSGNRISCPNCQAVYYPPTSPVGISLVSSPDHSKVLLQRNPRYPKGMYSCIAGFADVGETLFDCLKREVAEEGGVELLPDSTCTIISSQHWPFPAGSLMMGCMVYADPAKGASSDGLGGEVEDVAWFEAADVRNALAFIDTNPKMRLEGSADGKLFVPPKGTIANQMLTHWILKYHSSDLHKFK